MAMSATQVLAAHWDGKLPVDVARIAQALGAEMRPTAATELDGISGMIELQHGRPQLSYNTSESAVRQRFTIAHEVGHLALGHLEGQDQPLLRDPAAHFSAASLPPIEREANTFAAELLMPTKVLRFAVQVKQMLDVASLARAFGVSQVAMRYRLQNLGLLGGR